MSEYQSEVIFADGMIFKRPNEKAPKWVKGVISIKVDEFVPFLKKHSKNGWVNLNLKVSKGDKLYLSLDTWEPKKKDENADSDFINERI